MKNSRQNKRTSLYGPVVRAGAIGLLLVVGATAGLEATAAPVGSTEAPTVLSITPPSAPAAAGATVTIAGTGFTGATAVTFGPTPAASFTVDSDTQITASAPIQNGGTDDVEVTTPSGTSASSPSDQFTFLAPPPEPENVAAQIGTSRQAILTWIEPTVDGSSPATSYLVTSSRRSRPTDVPTTDCTGTPIVCTVTLNNLAANAEVSFTVRAQSDEGASIAAASNTVVPFGRAIIKLERPSSQHLVPGSPPLNLQIQATNNDGTAMTYAASNLPAGLAINSATGAITGTDQQPAIDNSATSEVAVTVTDEAGGSATTKFRVSKAGGSTAPPATVDTAAATPAATTSAATTTTPATLPVSGVHQVFDATFGGSSLDTSVWDTCFPYGECNNFGNPSEEEWYTPAQDQVSGGALHLVADATPTAGTNQDGAKETYPYASGMVTTYNSFSFTYGYIQVVAQLPGGTGTWPALWLAPENSTWPPEIDFMENWGDPNSIQDTYHYGSSSDDSQATQAIPSSSNLTTGYHTYGVDWEPGSLTYYLDGQVVATYTNSNVSSEPMYFIADLAIDGAAASGSSLNIQSVQIYQH